MAYTETALYVDSVAYTAVAAWTATHAYTVGQIVRQLAAPAAGSERCFICIIAGTSLSTEPTWVLTRGAKTVEAAGPTWMECTGLPALAADNTNTNAWHASAGAIALGWIIKNVANDHYFICTTAGTGGTGTEPTWNTTTGATTVDATVTWTCIGATSSFTTKWVAAHARLAKPLDGGANWLVNAGMNVYVGDDHAETNSVNMSPASSCSILCVDHTVALPPTSSNLKTTASVTMNQNQGFCSNTNVGYVYGLQFPAVNGYFISNAGGSRNRFESCTFTLSGGLIIFGSGQTGVILELKNCTFSAPNIASSNFQFQGGVIKIENGVFTAAGASTGNALMAGSTGATVDVTFEGCDFTGVPNTQYLIGLQAATSAYGKWLLKDCSLSAGMIIYSGATHLPLADNITIDLNRVDSGMAVYRNERYRYEGQLTTATGIVRTGGASDGATPISHQIVTNANTNNIQRVFNSVPFVIWNAVTGTNRNVTIRGIINDSRVPNNDEVWFEVEYLGSASSPQGSFARGGKANVLATASALTADTSGWDSAVTARANTTAYTVGQVIKTASNPGRVFFCTVAGITGASEPTAIAASAMTLNPADAAVGLTFSNGNLTVTHSGTINGGVRTLGAQASGKYYAESTWTGTLTSGSFGAFGIIGKGQAYTGPALGVIMQTEATNGPVFVNGSSIGVNIGTLVTGQTVCMAVDMDNLRIWFRINNGNWNGASTANPATNTGGVDISAAVAANGPQFGFVNQNFAGPTTTVNFGGSVFAYTPPAGFTAGPAQNGYTTMTDGQSVADGTATFRAGCRFSQTLTLTSPQPQQPGYLYAYPKIGRPSVTYYLDPMPVLS